MDEVIYLVSDEKGGLQFITEFKSVAERFIENYGNSNWTIETDGKC